MGTSLFALTCKSGAGHRQTCETWAPACSCLLPPERVNPGSPGRGTKSFSVIEGVIKNKFLL